MNATLLILDRHRTAVKTKRFIETLTSGGALVPGLPVRLRRPRRRRQAPHNVVVVASTSLLADAARAHRRAAEGELQGKIALAVARRE